MSYPPLLPLTLYPLSVSPVFLLIFLFFFNIYPLTTFYFCYPCASLQQVLRVVFSFSLSLAFFFLVCFFYLFSSLHRLIILSRLFLPPSTSSLCRKLSAVFHFHCHCCESDCQYQITTLHVSTASLLLLLLGFFQGYSHGQKSYIR